MPLNNDFTLKVIVGNTFLPEYFKDDHHYVESNFTTPYSYMDECRETVNGEIEIEKRPVTPYKLYIRAHDSTPHCYYRVFVDGQHVKSLSVKPNQARLIKGINQGICTRELLFSLPRFAKDIDDRIPRKLCDRVGSIEVNCYDAKHVESVKGERRHSQHFQQATKKDSTNVTKGNYMLSTSKPGKALSKKRRHRIDSWNVEKLRGSIKIDYRSAQCLKDIGISIEPVDFSFPSFEVLDLLETEHNTQQQSKKELCSGLTIDLTNESDGEKNKLPRTTFMTRTDGSLDSQKENLGQTMWIRNSSTVVLDTVAATSCGSILVEDDSVEIKRETPELIVVRDEEEFVSHS